MAKDDAANGAGWVSDPADHLRVGEGFDLAEFDRAATPGWEAGKTAEPEEDFGDNVELF